MSRFSRTWIRRLTSILMVLLLAVLGTLIAQRFRLLNTPVENVDGEQVVSEEGDRAVGVYTGFEYVERVAGELIFELLSKRTLGLSSGWHEIEGVRLQFHNDGEPGPALSCDRASFNIQTRDARLEGGIRIDLPDGAVLTAEAGTFEASSRRFTTDTDVHFVSGGSYGRARNATYDLLQNQVLLGGGVLLSSEKGGTLTAPTALYRRDDGTIEFSGGATIRIEQSEITAPRLVIGLEDEGGPIRRIELSGGVSARGYGVGGTASAEAWMEKLVAKTDARGRWQVEASTSGKWITILFTEGEGFIERKLETWILRGVLESSGEIVNLRGEQGVCIREVPVMGETRFGEARSARVWFKNGLATDIELLEDVILRGEEIEGRSFRARLSPEAGLSMLHGDPTGPERVLLISQRGRLSCDRAQLFHDEGRAEARGNVQGQVENVSLVGAPQQNDSLPTHFAAESLDVNNEGNEYHLRENTRLWQGHQMLLADDVFYRHDAGEVRAVGHVRTTMPASALDAAADPSADVVVVARSLDFDRSVGEAIYRGNVHYSDPEHTLSAAELSIFFDDDNELTAIEALGAVELVELATGRRMTGRFARRETISQIITVEGSPVRLTDPEGNTVSGSSLTWNQADGTVAVAGGTETIYYPEESP